MADSLLELTGLRLVVVGGGHGIGRACVELAAGAGAHVAVVDTDLAAAHDLVDAQRSAGRPLHAVGGDACDYSSMERAAGTIVGELGGVDAVVNLVGGAKPRAFLDMSVAEWRREITFNLDSAYFVARAFVPHLVESGGGALVSSSSGYGARPKALHTGYGAAKAGVIGFTRSLALELAPKGVRVNAVAPGATDTPRIRELLGEDGLAAAIEATPLGRVAQPEDCAIPALFLASPASRHITGHVLHVNGGVFMP